MTRSNGIRNKLIYLAVLIAMLIPLYLLGQPAGGGAGDAGGRLTQMRVQYNIAESELGDINPASETAKLASLGLRGVAATLLWSKAHDYKVHHEWDRLKATLNNIALLQPHYEKVWEFQAHNLSYNVSAEFDDYRQRYAMVREGIEYLTRGVETNRKAPALVWNLGWFYGNKIGMSDEKTQFRRLFADDTPQHEALRQDNIAVDSPDARGPDGKPDNWLVGRLWLFHAYDMVDSGVRLRNKTPLHFYETGPKARIKHAEAIESEGVLDDRAKSAWQLAADDWQTYGQWSIPTTSPFTIKLSGLSELRELRDDAYARFMAVAGETFESLEEELRQTLTAAEQEAMDTPEEERTEEQHQMVSRAYSRMSPRLETVARQAPAGERLRAIELAQEVADLDARLQKTVGQRDQVNYQFWETLTKAEQEDRTIDARRLLYEAEQANADADLDLAIEKYEAAFELWAEIFDDYTVLLFDEVGDALQRSIRRYMVAVDSDEFDETFPLQAFVQYKADGSSQIADEYQRLRAEQLEKLAQRQADSAATPEPEATSDPESAPEPEAAEAGETPGEAEMSADAEAAESPAEAEPGAAATSEAETPVTDESPAADGAGESSADDQPVAGDQPGAGESAEAEPAE